MRFSVMATLFEQIADFPPHPAQENRVIGQCIRSGEDIVPPSPKGDSQGSRKATNLRQLARGPSPGDLRARRMILR